MRELLELTLSAAELLELHTYARTVPGRAGGVIRELTSEVEVLRAALQAAGEATDLGAVGVIVRTTLGEQ